MRSDRIVYHNNGGQDDGSTTVVGLNTQINSSIALNVAKYVLMRLVDGDSVIRLIEEFDNDARFINGIVEFLRDMEWVKQDNVSGLYQMTKIGEREVRISASKVILWI
jgi:hypothetical protein